jgi:hypothetical protein
MPLSSLLSKLLMLLFTREIDFPIAYIKHIIYVLSLQARYLSYTGNPVPPGLYNKDVMFNK